MRIFILSATILLSNYCFSQNNIGINNTNPKSPLAVNGAIGNTPTIVTTQSTLEVPYVLSSSSTIFIFKALNVLDFPLPSSCPGRIYVIVNLTSGQLTIPFTENIRSLANTLQTSVISFQSNTFVSDGSNWQRISGM